MGFGYGFSELRKVVEQTPFISQVLGEMCGSSIKTSSPATCEEQMQGVVVIIPNRLGLSSCGKTVQYFLHLFLLDVWEPSQIL